MLTSFILSALIESVTLAPRPISCSFPARTPGERPIEIVMTARPSLKDLPGLYRVEVSVDDRKLNGSAQPILATETRDVLVRASRTPDIHYTVGFDAAGAAALNVVRGGKGETPGESMTRIGNCRNVDPYIRDWAAQ